MNRFDAVMDSDSEMADHEPVEAVKGREGLLLVFLDELLDEVLYFEKRLGNGNCTCQATQNRIDCPQDLAYGFGSPVLDRSIEEAIEYPELYVEHVSGEPSALEPGVESRRFGEAGNVSGKHILNFRDEPLFLGVRPKLIDLAVDILTEQLFGSDDVVQEVMDVIEKMEETPSISGVLCHRLSPVRARSG